MEEDVKTILRILTEAISLTTRKTVSAYIIRAEIYLRGEKWPKSIVEATVINSFRK